MSSPAVGRCSAASRGRLPLDELLALLLSLALLSGSDGPSNAGTTAMVSAAADGTSQGSALGVT